MSEKRVHNRCKRSAVSLAEANKPVGHLRRRPMEEPPVHRLPHTPRGLRRSASAYPFPSLSPSPSPYMSPFTSPSPFTSLFTSLFASLFAFAFTSLSSSRP